MSISFFLGGEREVREPILCNLAQSDIMQRRDYNQKGSVGEERMLNIRYVIRGMAPLTM